MILPEYFPFKILNVVLNPLLGKFHDRNLCFLFKTIHVNLERHTVSNSVHVHGCVSVWCTQGKTRLV